jgi:hypothetical protein
MAGIAIVGAMLLAPVVARAQRQTIVIGAIIGYTRADFAGIGTEIVRSTSGTLAGGFLRIPLTRWLAVEPEALFARKGGAVGDRSGPNPFRVDADFVYIEVPVLARVSLLPSGRIIRPMFFIGPAPALRIGCDVVVTEGTTITRGVCEDPHINAQVPRKVDFGVVLGGGFGIPIGNAVLGIEGRASLGVRSIYSDGSPSKNRAFSLLLEIPF